MCFLYKLVPVAKPVRSPVVCAQGIAGLDCWIDQSGLQSNFVDWIAIANQKNRIEQ